MCCIHEFDFGRFLDILLSSNAMFDPVLAPPVILLKLNRSVVWLCCYGSIHNILNLGHLQKPISLSGVQKHLWVGGFFLELCLLLATCHFCFTPYLPVCLVLFFAAERQCGGEQRGGPTWKSQCAAGRHLSGESRCKTETSTGDKVTAL